MQHYDSQDLERMASQIEYLTVLNGTMMSRGHRNGKQMSAYTMTLMSIAETATRMARDSFHEGIADHWRTD